MGLSRRRGLDLRRSGGFVGMGGLACLLFLYLGSLAFLDWWVVAALVVLWLVLGVVGGADFTRRPLRVLWLPVVGLVVWLVVVVLLSR